MSWHEEPPGSGEPPALRVKQALEAMPGGSPIERLFLLMSPEQQRELIREVLRNDLSRQTYLDARDAADYLRFPNAQAFKAFVRRNIELGFAACRMGTRTLYHRATLDRVVQPDHLRQKAKLARLLKPYDY